MKSVACEKDFSVKVVSSGDTSRRYLCESGKRYLIYVGMMGWRV